YVEMDYRMYMCSACFGRYLWHELSSKEHKCPHCRLPKKTCLNCDGQFEPREKTVRYCNRCSFYMETNQAVKPQQLPTDEEETEVRHGSSITERWEAIKNVAGIVDDPD
ncbi:hypothetical protein KR018_008251, partial [Drosophila ironensis]